MTAPAPLALPEDLAARVGDDSPTRQQARARAVLADASAAVRGDGDPTWTAESAPPQAVSIVLAVAKRVWRNPDGYTSETLPGGFARTWAAGAVGRDLAYLTEQETQLVRRLAGKSGLRTVQLTRDGCGDLEQQLVDVAGGGDPILYYAESDLDELGWTDEG